MAELLDRIHSEIRERLDASRAAVLEYELLEAALAALGEPEPAPRRARTSRRAEPAPAVAAAPVPPAAETPPAAAGTPDPIPPASTDAPQPPAPIAAAAPVEAPGTDDVAAEEPLAA